jgi:hypothetical protein
MDEFETKYHKPKTIARNFDYVLARKVDRGSINEREERLLRIFFTLHDIILKTKSLGLPNSQDLAANPHP